MFQVMVVTGEYCKGNEEMVAAPWKTDESGEYIQPMQQYDLVVDNVNNPAMYLSLMTMLHTQSTSSNSKYQDKDITQTDYFSNMEVTNVVDISTEVMRNCRNITFCFRVFRCCNLRPLVSISLTIYDFIAINLLIFLVLVFFVRSFSDFLKLPVFAGA